VESIQIKNGFSDLKDDFRTRLRIQKSMNNLRLWFSVSNGEVYVHDYSNHYANMILALRHDSTSEWKIFVKEKTYRYSLVRFFVDSYPLELLQDQLNEQFNLYGHWQPGNH
jgi:hypothetical protein